MAGAGAEFSTREAGPLEMVVIGAPGAERFAATTRRPAAALAFARQLTGIIEPPLCFSGLGKNRRPVPIGQDRNGATTGRRGAGFH